MAYRGATGTLGALNAFVDINVADCSSAAIQFTAGLIGTVSFYTYVQDTVPDATHITVVNRQDLAFSGGSIPGPTSTVVNPGAAITYVAATSGVAVLRVQVSAYTSGSCVVSIGADEAAMSTSGQQVVSYIKPTSNSAGTLHRLVGAGTTNATSVKASQGNLYTAIIANTSAAIKYVKFYNKASAPTVGTDTPVITIGIPPTSTYNFESVGTPWPFSTGIAYATTVLSADADTTAITAGDIIVSLVYL
jgi:hypothetical protein